MLFMRPCFVLLRCSTIGQQVRPDTERDWQRWKFNAKVDLFVTSNRIFEYADKIVPMFFSECGFKV